jgi:hypothetical protein
MQIEILSLLTKLAIQELDQQFSMDIRSNNIVVVMSDI